MISTTHSPTSPPSLLLTPLLLILLLIPRPYRRANPPTIRAGSSGRCRRGFGCANGCGYRRTDGCMHESSEGYYDSSRIRRSRTQLRVGRGATDGPTAVLQLLRVRIVGGGRASGGSGSSTTIATHDQSITIAAAPAAASACGSVRAAKRRPTALVGTHAYWNHKASAADHIPEPLSSRGISRPQQQYCHRRCY
jgi:hypothetical protein